MASEREMAVVRGVALRKLEASGYKFVYWKRSVKRILVSEQLWDVVDPDGKQRDGICERKKEARAIIQAAMAFHIKGNTDPRECWIYLQNRFAPNTPARRFEFLKLRMKEGERVWKFFSRVNDVLDMGEAHDERQLVLMLLCALPPSWDLFTLNVCTDMLTKDELYSKCLRHEHFMECRALRLGN